MKQHAAVVPHLAGKVDQRNPDIRWLNESRQFESNWLMNVHGNLQDTSTEEKSVSWAAYHADRSSDNDFCRSISCLLPLFPENADSPAMLKHGMEMVSKVTSYVNPGQTPVIAGDQPLFALMKQIQWQFQSTHGEDKFVVMLGGLHIEMTFVKAIGSLLTDSGWTELLTTAHIASSGKAESFLKASHIRRTRRAHEVTACALFHLLNEAYQHDQSSDKPFEEWISSTAKSAPTFHFWMLILNMQVLLLSFVGSLRNGKFEEYIQTLEAIAPWMFALDHTNYARWLPVHISDMKNLHLSHPQIYEEFKKGNFVVHKTERLFSAIPFDYAHEQNNADVKGDGGAIGLTENLAALRRWTVGGPEVNRVLQEFQVSLQLVKPTSLEHHEQCKSTQSAFLKDVQSLTNVIKEFGNPFLEDGNELLVITTKDVASQSVVDSLANLEKLGRQQYCSFIEERIAQSTPLSAPIKKNKMRLLSTPTCKPSSTKVQVASLKNDCSLFSRLYISCQTREGNLEEFFKHENQPCPPAPSHMGQLRPSAKSQLLTCLDDLSVQQTPNNRPEVDVTILDGAAVINMLKPGDKKTFSAYQEEVFAKYVVQQLGGTSRLDIVWDVYKEDSLKGGARSRRGNGQRRRVVPEGSLPQNWQQFLRNDDNKDLFTFLGHASVNITTDKHIISTVNDSVVSNKPYDTSDLSPCNHEEADTRILLHMTEACTHGHDRFLIRTVDTDVVVLAIARAAILDVSEVWVAFGTGKSFHYIAVHEITASLGPRKSFGLPIFHSITGCDTVSSFSGCGKKKAWQVWSLFDEVTDVFEALAECPSSIPDSYKEILERFVILMYDRTSESHSMNQSRKHLFAAKGRAIENIPPTSAAFQEHVKRAVYQGGHVWSQCHIRCPDLPDPGQWGWQRNENNHWEPFWSVLPDISKTCQELLKCGCKKGCGGRCKCRNAELKCTALCNCGGDC